VRLPSGYDSRAATPGDLDDVVALVKACDLADVGIEDPVREHIDDDWRTADDGLDRHVRLAFAADGPLAGLAQVFGTNPERFLDAWVRVHPEHRGRGLGAALIEWTEACARRLAPSSSPTLLYNSVPIEDGAADRLLVGLGYAPARVFWHMERALRNGLEPGGIPKGIGIGGYRPETDAEAVRATLVEVFADHWGHEPDSPEEHAERFERQDRGLVWVARDGDEVVGVLVARTVEGSGWIDDVGVRARWRGRGIGRSLLLVAFAELAARGVASVSLNVDSENATGATSLYESAGMRVRRAWRVYEKPLS
jgi:mycothiol synthase